MPLEVILSCTGEVAITTQEALLLVLLLEVALERPRRFECFVTSRLAAHELWCVVHTDLVTCEVVRLGIGFGAQSAGVLLSSCCHDETLFPGDRDLS